jgi:hypothetical protein
MPLFVSSKENRKLNSNQSLGVLKFTSADPAFVKETIKCVYLLIPETATAPEMPATRAFSRQRVAYIAAFLPESHRSVLSPATTRTKA